MICPHCFGRRVFYARGQMAPCPTCEGFGELHGCDGLQAQPGAPAEDEPRPAPRVLGHRPTSTKVVPPARPLVGRR